MTNRLLWIIAKLLVILVITTANPKHLPYDELQFFEKTLNEISKEF